MVEGVHFSSRVNEVIRTILGLFIYFFYKKILSAQKCKSSQNQTTKQKQANKKQQRQQFFDHKNFQEVENCLFHVFLYLKSLLKKIEIVLITLFTLLLTVCV